MGRKVNLYLDDESLDLWHSIPSGHRSQIVRDALKSVGFPDENREEILFTQEKNSINKEKKPNLEKEFRDLLVSKGRDAGGIAAKFSSGNYREMKVNVGKGLWMTYAQRLNFTKIELYIYRGPRQGNHGIWARKGAVQTWNLFEQFEWYRDNVEEYFGEGLDWTDREKYFYLEDEKQKKACRIGKKYKDFDLYNRECWDSIASEMVSDMNRLNSALRPIYMELRRKTPHEYRRMVKFGHGGVSVPPGEWKMQDIGSE